MRRREFITLVSGAAVAWPLVSHAQQSALPVVGLLETRSPDAFPEGIRAVRQGLKDAGFVERENVVIEYRWGENQADRLPMLAAELVRLRVAVIVTMGGEAAAFAVKAATATIPIVFVSGQDPVKQGLVASLARPGGNLTGVNFFAGELAAKRLELLRELVPGAARVAVLVDPSNMPVTESTLRDVETAARAMGLQTKVLKASTSGEIDAAFASLERERPDALFVGGAPFFTARRVQLALAAGRYGIPAIFVGRQYAEAGGLMSYGPNVSDAYRQMGVYAGHILKGAKPADLPVVQSSKFELIINRQTAMALGLTVQPKLLAIADEVIE